MPSRCWRPHVMTPCCLLCRNLGYHSCCAPSDSRRLQTTGHTAIPHPKLVGHHSTDCSWGLAALSASCGTEDSLMRVKTRSYTARCNAREAHGQIQASLWLKPVKRRMRLNRCSCNHACGVALPATSCNFASKLIKGCLWH